MQEGTEPSWKSECVGVVGSFLNLFEGHLFYVYSSVQEQNGTCNGFDGAWPTDGAPRNCMIVMAG
jgi:hypothetical protein